MSINWSSISAGAMTAGVSLGHAVQSLGAAAATTLPAMTAPAVDAISTSAETAARTLPAASAQAMTVSAQAVNSGAAATATSKLATDIAVVEKPAKAIAAAAPNASVVSRAIGFLSKALPVVTIGASALAGAQIVQQHGAQGLVTRKEGRGAVLGAIGGGLLLVPHPVTQLAAAGVLGATAVNHFGGMDRLNTAQVRMPWDPPNAAPRSPAQ